MPSKVRRTSPGPSRESVDIPKSRVDPASGAATPGRSSVTAAPPATDALVAGLALVLHRYLTRRPDLLVCRYELALEATRRPGLRTFCDATGRQLREPLEALMTAAGWAAPQRHALSLVAWCEGLMFSCTAGSYHRRVPTKAALRTGFGELPRGMPGGR